MENKQRKKSWLDTFMAWLLAVLRKSFIGRFFTSYYEANQRFITKTKRRKGRSVRKFARFIERNRLIGCVPKITDFLLRIPLRDYGIAMFLTGVGVVLLYPLNGMILFISVSFELFVLGISVSICSLPLMFSSRSLASNILSSRMFSFIFFGFFGMDDEGFREAAEKPKVSFAVFSIIIGMLLAVAGYFITPVGVVLLILGIAFAYSAIRTPEVGAILTILLLPYVNTYFICGCIAYTFVCYAIKVKLGKRVFRFEYFDLWVSIALVCLTLCGFNYANPLSSIKSVLLNLIILMSYFLYANLIYSKVWFRRSIVAFTGSSMVVAIVAIIQAILRSVSSNVSAVEKVFSADGDIVSTFSSSTVLAQFMVIAIPFALVHMISEKKDITKFGGFIMAAILVAALVLAESAMGIFGLLVGALLIFAFYKRTAIYLLLLVALALPLLYVLLPDNAISLITSWKTLEGVSVKQEILYLKDGFLAIIKHPLGANLKGTTSLSLYGAESFDSSPLQMLAQYGIIGVVAFAVMVVMFMRVIFSYSVKAKNAYRRVNGCAGLCSILALLTVGIFNDVWADKKIYLMFVITMALSLAYIKIDRDEEAVAVTYIDITTATLDIPLREAFVHTGAPQRRYIHAPKMQKHLKRQKKIKVAEAKEFSNTDELIITRKKYENDEAEEQK